MKPLYIATRIVEKVHIPLTRDFLATYNGTFEVTDEPPEDKGWSFSWGVPHRQRARSVMELGFFWSSVHIDSDIYKHAAFNDARAPAIVRSYRAPKHAVAVLAEADKPQTKYNQHKEDVRWEGVVLALQQSKDLSIRRCGSTEAYMAFVEGACKHYGKHLLLKLHPFSNEEAFSGYEAIAKKYGGRIARTNHTCIEHCRLVLVYNSTFCVDCFVRGVPVAQFAPGYFYKSGAVTYTDGTYPDDVEDTVEAGSRLADFLVWRYCFVQDMPKEKWVEVLHAYAGSKGLFPLPEELSWAANTQYCAKTGVWRF
jgi:hypothetical protein